MANQISNISPKILVIITLISIVFNNNFRPIDAEETGKALIESTCKKTQYPEECISALESNPGSFTANLTGLTRIAVEKSASKLVETLHIVETLVLNATDYLTWGFLVNCRDTYNISVPQIRRGLQAFDQLKFDKSYKSVEAVNNAVIGCDRQGWTLPILTQVNRALFRLTKDTMMILHLLF
ncbi:cell wall / vacuolar inhibitor of fructosidase 2-like [Gossypium arboreum]|uniref:Pectinesterase inhibitor domain-containing protein n=1 Tax=Gossypium arboreum TaxID=29729 RepID=A0ABR0N7Y8_GOSAR|nr:cell wall / vacuolar inhibitor of fructosidase 2-like [Gossypium arboreum]KAK5786710.1 hypothetical protein PVK06_041353 [Gossypium arboreum]